MFSFESGEPDPALYILLESPLFGPVHPSRLPGSPAPGLLPTLDADDSTRYLSRVDDWVYHPFELGEYPDGICVTLCTV